MRLNPHFGHELQKGASLLQIMLLVSVISGVSLLTLNQHQATTKKVNANLLNQDLWSLSEKIEGVFADSTVCKGIFTKNEELYKLPVAENSGSAPETALTKIVFADGKNFLSVTDEQQNPGDETATTWYGFTKKIALSSITVQRPTVNIGKITLTYTLHDDVTGLREFSKYIHLNLEGDATNVTGCQLANNIPGDVSDAVKRTCQGPGAVYDPTTYECHIIGVNATDCEDGSVLKGLQLNASTFMMEPLCEVVTPDPPPPSGDCGTWDVPYGFNDDGSILCKPMTGADVWHLLATTQQDAVDEDCRWKKGHLNIVNNKIRVDCASGPVSPDFPKIKYNYLGKSKGFHFCALDHDGYAYCWGLNNFGQLGDGSAAETLKPVKVSGDLQFKAIAAGGYHTCGITKDQGDVYCWGNNSDGQLGTGNNINYKEPTKVTLPNPAISVTAGMFHTCILDAVNSHRFCWGNNESGQLGKASFDAGSSIPNEVTTEKYLSLSAGGNSTCGIQWGGAVFCWGDNYLDQLGDADPIHESKSVPTRVTAYDYHSIPGRLISSNELTLTTGGDGKTYPSNTFSEVDVSESHACAVTNNENIVACWGSNLYGHLGSGNYDNYNGMLSTQYLGSNIVTSATSSLFIYNLFDVFGMGGLGPVLQTCLQNPASMNFTTPTILQVQLGYVSVATTKHASCALSYDGNIYCWGGNDLGTLGDGSLQASYCPVEVAQP